MKGIICAGGQGTRLRPATYAMNKHMVSILSKPMILYPLETLKSLGIKDILIVTGGNHVGMFADFLGDGSKHDVNLTYRVQSEAGGIAQAIGLAKDFVGNDSVAVILGDNIYDNTFFPKIFPKNAGIENAHLIFSKVKDPKRFGVPSFNPRTGALDGIEEKPKEPKSNFAVTGFYIYPPDVFEIISTLKPSLRGETEVSDINDYYIKQGRCDYTVFTRFWSDAGTPESLATTTAWAIKQLNKIS